MTTDPPFGPGTVHERPRGRFGDLSSASADPLAAPHPVPSVRCGAVLAWAAANRVARGVARVDEVAPCTAEQPVFARPSGDLVRAAPAGDALTGRDINEQTLRSAPTVYHRSKVTPITLTPGGAQDSVSCNPGDTAIFGKEGAGANPLSYRTGGNLRNKSTYTGIVYGEPAAAGQRTNLILTIACLARARR